MPASFRESRNFSQSQEMSPNRSNSLNETINEEEIRQDIPTLDESESNEALQGRNFSGQAFSRRTENRSPLPSPTISSESIDDSLENHVLSSTGPNRKKSNSKKLMYNISKKAINRHLKTFHNFFSRVKFLFYQGNDFQFHQLL